MSIVLGRGTTVRFAEFEVDLRSGELRTNGISVRLQPQPSKVLALLVRRRGETVSRTEIVEEVWGSETFVDYEQGLNFAIRQIRSALGDDAEHPVYVETVPKRGYRFVAPVTGIADVSMPVPESSPGTSRDWRGQVFKFAAGAILLTGMFLLAIPKTRHWFQGLASRQPIQSLAVLPFENLTGDASKDYFADGFTDELITDLAEQTKIRVVSRSSVMRYKGTHRSLPEIAKELKVDAIVEGSVSLSDQQVRITAQLIQASSDRHLWAHNYERDRKDLFSVQSEVAATIAGLVGSTQGSAAARSMSSSERYTPETYELSLGCRSLARVPSDEGMKRMIKCFERVLALDPGCAPAYVKIAEGYLALGLDSVSKARSAATKAIELDPSLPEAHRVLAEVKMQYDKDLPGAENEIDASLALNPSSGLSHLDRAWVFLASARAADAVKEARAAQELDPFLPHTNLGMMLFMAGQYDRAIEEEKTDLELFPDDDRAFYWLGYAYEQKGMYKDAIAEYKKRLPLDDHGIYLVATGRASLLAGDLKSANGVKQRIEHWSGKYFVWPYDGALFYAALGDKDRALEWLERDQNERDGWLLLLNVDPRLAPLRSDPRFQALVKRVGLPIAATN